jgi:hypothetical protein
MDVTQTEKENIEEIFLNHFKLLYTSHNPINISDTTHVVHNRLNQGYHDHISKEFTADEVFLAIKDMKSLAAPGPDALLARFELQMNII